MDEKEKLQGVRGFQEQELKVSHPGCFRCLMNWVRIETDPVGPIPSKIFRLK